jgi:hypothetical protein
MENLIDIFIKKYSYKFPKGYPDFDKDEDKKILNEIFKSLNILKENTPSSEYGYKIGEFTTPSETLEGRNWDFTSRVGYLGTGFYFYGDKDTAEKDKTFLNRKSPIKKFPLSDYNLFRSSNPEEFYNDLKLITKELGTYASSGDEMESSKLNEALDEIYDIIKNDMGINLEKQQTFTILQQFIEDIKNKKPGTMLSNRLLQPLGYDGIDNTNTNLDNYGVGSVIFI